MGVEVLVATIESRDDVGTDGQGAGGEDSGVAVDGRCADQVSVIEEADGSSGCAAGGGLERHGHCDGYLEGNVGSAESER